MPDITPQITTAIQQQWELQLPDTVTEEELLKMLALKIATLLGREPETFFQLMYRLDISEKKLRVAMIETDPPMAIACLVYQRQLQKVQSRKQYKSSSDEDEELKW